MNTTAQGQKAKLTPAQTRAVRWIGWRHPQWCEGIHISIQARVLHRLRSLGLLNERNLRRTMRGGHIVGFRLTPAGRRYLVEHAK